MIELNKIYNEDCLEGIKRIPDGSVDAVITDPPYGITKCEWDKVVCFDELWSELYRVCKPNAGIVMFGSEPFTSHLILSNIENFREKLIWVKHKPSNFGCVKYRQLRYTEDIVVFGEKITFHPQMTVRESPRIQQAQKTNYVLAKGNKSSVSFQCNRPGVSSNHYSATEKYEGNVLYYNSIQGNSNEKVNHPTQKPIKLLSRLIITYTDPLDTILDPFMGSGTTAVAAIRNNRNFIGFELQEKYFDIANRRIEAEQLSL